ncbi:hypothetical protein EN845_10485 [Mesorhizobium sp. M8A.F.Ca.ET.202.01.1.1]|nr:hypothetical protein EN845_10485 [Mesorhizobium sp. M8A.F.Ca.ET.202.01.1.1]TGR47091.1 hypothetical protein EN842_22210 [bacterium M00.F.Ca.ET.199.01.1.1]TGR55116.1 hypothetical protein EN841_07320 [Mesorhizobium sp. M8A.F.Ca.ET.198.01.1.1]TGU36544.1 hypothetical protein EN799_12990 [bacterium M00.F.Ca.ET.156.01.1.1]TGV87733.1 hypothetical protein EN792_009235 [Mesorhizobium sp. M00.F.Ca.ET.149.01.1.1]
MPVTPRYCDSRRTRPTHGNAGGTAPPSVLPDISPTRGEIGSFSASSLLRPRRPFQGREPRAWPYRNAPSGSLCPVGLLAALNSAGSTTASRSIITP